ncbi:MULTISPECIES: hypothetical protein [Cryobacterium]|uniref:hypothetical protein n=1 Tax=Cryobacterium TaxID=69578 RepID=UPI001E3FA226|nr:MULTISPECIES: hypothetical protein [Cryobacterium]
MQHAKSGEGSLSVRSGTQHGHEYRVLGSLKGLTDAIEPTLVTLTCSSTPARSFSTC